MTQLELNKILKNHKHWLDEDCDGWETMRASFKYANLTGANLTGANLAGANLVYANLEDAVLTNANLHGADLFDANLSCATLATANLTNANLSDANLEYANLTYANLAGAHLHGANLANAIITGAVLEAANLRGAKNVPFFPLVCPDSGSFIAYKKASGYIVKLQIPKDAKRLSATGRKCRCDKAQVLEIQNLDGTTANITEVESDYDRDFIYKVGKTVSVDNFDENRWNECSTGIHFFVNRQEAVQY